MKKLSKKVFGAIAIAVCGGVYAKLLYDLSEARDDATYWKDKWEKEMRDCVDWQFMAKRYRFSRCLFSLETLDSEFDDMWKKHIDSLDND